MVLYFKFRYVLTSVMTFFGSGLIHEPGVPVDLSLHILNPWGSKSPSRIGPFKADLIHNLDAFQKLKFVM